MCRLSKCSIFMRPYFIVSCKFRWVNLFKPLFISFYVRLLIFVFFFIFCFLSAVDVFTTYQRDISPCVCFTSRGFDNLKVLNIRGSWRLFSNTFLFKSFIKLWYFNTTNSYYSRLYSSAANPKQKYFYQPVVISFERSHHPKLHLRCLSILYVQVY